VYRLLQESQKERALGRPRWRWVDNIKMALAEIGLDGMDWIGMSQERASIELL
jgi:hypothetical protein